MFDDDTVLIQEGATISFREDQIAEESETKGRYRKMLFRYGSFVDAFTGERDLNLTKELAEELKANLEAKAIERVPVPVDHTRDPKANTGELLEIEVGEDAAYGIIQIRDYDAIYRIENDLVFDVSVKINWNYIDTETGKEWGAILEHVALVNDPYIEHMTGFETVVANASDDTQDEYSKGMRKMLKQMSTSLSRQYSDKSVIMLSVNANKAKGDDAMEVDVTNSRDFDVEVTYTRDDEEVKATVKAGEIVTVPADQEEAVKKQIEDAVEPTDEEDDELSKEEKDKQAAELAKGKGETVELSKTEHAALVKMRDENQALKAESDYATLSKEGFLVPAQKEAYLAMHKQFSNDSATVSLSREDGKTEAHSILDAMNGLIRAGGKSIEFSQSGTQDADEDEESAKPLSKQLSKDQLASLEKDHNISADKIDELAKKNPAFAQSMLDEVSKDKE